MSRSLSRFIRAKKPLESSNRIPASVLKREKKARKSLEHRTKCEEQAELVKNGSVSLRKAAQECGINEKQMAQHVAQATKGRQPCSATAATNFPAQ